MSISILYYLGSVSKQYSIFILDAYQLFNHEAKIFVYTKVLAFDENV